MPPVYCYHIKRANLINIDVPIDYMLPRSKGAHLLRVVWLNAAIHRRDDLAHPAAVLYIYE